MIKRLCFAFLLLPPASVFAAVADDVSVLVAASHGMNPESGPAVMNLLAKIQADCGPYMTTLVKHVDPGWISADASGERARRAENAVVVLAGCHDAGRASLAGRFAQLTTTRERSAVALTERAAQLRKPQHPELVAKAKALAAIDGVRGTIVDALGDAKDSRLRDPLLATFQDENVAMQLRALDYFKRATPRDPTVKAKLAPLLERRDSRFYQSQKLRSVIE